MFRSWLFTCVALSLGCACSTNSSDVGGVKGNVHGGGAGGSGAAGGSAGLGSGGSAGNSGGASGAGAGCDALAAEILRFADANRACSTSADCTALSLDCGASPDHCSGVYAVNSGYDTAREAELRSASQACAGQCGGCPAIVGPAECNGGRCEFADLNACGGPNDIPCGDTDFCDVSDDAECATGDCYGECKARPEGCLPATCPGACGRDGNVYCGECEANLAGVDVDPEDSCNLTGKAAGELCDQDTDCQGKLRCCYPCGIAGCDNQCTATDSSGECPAFP